MSGKVNLILGVHNHLPNGAADEEYEALYNDRIRPLVSALYQFPRIHLVFHYSGVLYHWVERRHPELFVLLDDLLNRKQAELLGGGFYEPMMPLLPVADRIGQIEMQTTYLRKQFGRRPLGCWLPANSWEQNMVVPLGACGMTYTFLDESCFAAAGANAVEGNWYEPCITEDQGKIITVFPVFSSLKDKKPMAMLEKILNPPFSGQGPITVFPDFDFSREQVSTDDGSVIKTYPSVKIETEYQHFFEEFSVADSCIEFTTPGRFYKNLKGLKKLYFTGCCISDEVSKYISKDISSKEISSREASPRQFLTHYPEAGNIYAKMIHTRVLINQLRGDKARKHAALDELWKAQDSAIFSYNFLKNSMVRKAAYRALLEADNITREKGSFTPSSVFDYDLDGEDEYVFQDEKINCYIKARGASLFELDFLPAAWNYLDTWVTPQSASCRNECRRSFADYLFPGKTHPEISWQGIKGARFCGAEIFQCAELERTRRIIQFILPPQEGMLLGNIEIKKILSLKRNVLTFKYELKNYGKETEHFTLIPSIDLSFSRGDDLSLKIFVSRGAFKEGISLLEKLSIEDIGGLEFRDLKNEVVLSLESSRPFNAGIFNIEPDEYQFTCIMPSFPVSLEPGKAWDLVFSLKISS
jgi:hypothetical protein